MARALADISADCALKAGFSLAPEICNLNCSSFLRCSSSTAAAPVKGAGDCLLATLEGDSSELRDCSTEDGDVGVVSRCLFSDWVARAASAANDSTETGAWGGGDS